MVHDSLRQDIGKLEGPAKPHLAIELETSELFAPAMLKFAPCKNFSPRADPSKQASKANLICSGSKFFLGANSVSNIFLKANLTFVSNFFAVSKFCKQRFVYAKSSWNSESP
jgi:hypothetical protein